MPAEKDLKRGICSYHLCRKRSKVHKCTYCGEFFCEKHLRATPPGPARFSETDEEDKRFMEEWHKEGGHPCPPYLDVFKEQIRKQKLEFSEALDRLKEQKEMPPPPQDYEFKQDKQEPFRTNKNENFFKIAVVIIFSLLGLFVIWTFINAESSNYCMDGTSYGQCSNIKPLYCFNKTLISRADLCGCPANFSIREEACEEFGKCEDNTSSGHCSINQPLYCLNGVLADKADLCGCPSGLIVNGSRCVEPPRCEDGTLYDTCSTNKPFYCSEGILIQKARICGCPYEYNAVGETCISRYETNPKEISLEYTLRGQKGSIDYTVYGGLNSYLANKPRTFVCNPICPSDRQMELSQIDEPKQIQYLLPLVRAIERETDDEDDRARIAINLVQTIPYDWETFHSGYLTGRYPYEVLYDQKGVCGEKAKLLAFLLRELGYGTALFTYENHQAVGIKCPGQYSMDHSGYCFIESTTQSIITDNKGNYVMSGDISDDYYSILDINSGNSFDTISEEYADARDFIRIRDTLESEQQYLDWEDYAKYAQLFKKYGMEIDDEQ